MSTTTEAKPTTGVVTVESAAVFARALGNVAPHMAPAVESLPVLSAVRFEVADGTLTVIATDRYVLATDTCAVHRESSSMHEAAFLVDAADVTKVLRMLKGVQPIFPLAVKVEAETITFDLFGDAVRCYAVPGTFPRWHGLWPTGEPVATERFAFNPKQLVKLAKVQTDQRGPACPRVTFYGERKGALVEVGDTFRALVMPVRQP